jgi:hypothetical protein
MDGSVVNVYSGSLEHGRMGLSNIYCFIAVLQAWYKYFALAISKSRFLNGKKEPFDIFIYGHLSKLFRKSSMEMELPSTRIQWFVGHVH